VDAVLKEFDLYCHLFEGKIHIKELHLGGGTPTFFAPENLKELIEGILKRATLSHDYEFSFEGHPNNTTQEHLQTLYNLGFRRVSFGVQDYNETVQKAIHRLQPLENVKRVTEAARNIGYTSIGHDIIFGLPFQDVDHVKETIEKTKFLRPDRIAFYSYAHVPWLKGNGQRGFRDEDLPSAEVKRLQYETGKALLAVAGYHEIGMDHFALSTDSLYKSMENGQLHRNFMGYSATKTQTMIGLGVSAISDSWYGFAQNVKNIEEYYHLLKENIIPVNRGHILSSEDLIIRKHILNLMCQFETSWSSPHMFLNELPFIMAELKEMEADGLIEGLVNGVKVTNKGKPYVRNVCMAFDLLLQRKKPEARLFSMTV
jgi:oxygen-independent coproporphyrinogen-3 oxidase